MKLMKQSGMTLMETVIGMALAGVTVTVSMEAIDSSGNQKKAVESFETVSLLRHELGRLANNAEHLVSATRDANASIKACVPSTLSVLGKFEGTCPLDVPIPISVPKQGGLKGNISGGSTAVTYSADGSLCSNGGPKRCYVAARSYLIARCVSGNCGSNKGPDMVSVVVELRDMRDDRTDEKGNVLSKLPFEKQPLLGQVTALHDFSTLKSAANSNSVTTGACPVETINGFASTGVAVGMQGGKIVCGYHDPLAYRGDKGATGAPGTSFLPGNPGPNGPPGARGPKGQGCVASQYTKKVKKGKKTEEEDRWKVSC